MSKSWDVDEQTPFPDGRGNGMGLIVCLVVAVMVTVGIALDRRMPWNQPIEPAVVSEPEPEPVEEANPPRTIEEMAADADRDGATFLTEEEHRIVDAEWRRQHWRSRLPDDLVPELRGDGYYWWRHNGRDFRWHTLKEGQQYTPADQSVSFKFKGGVMEVVYP